uniref:30S ribosomal protein S8 n=1 Tax=Nephromyces sp. ex Molgula occidentalis TaxID=2544991 RepID=A0A5C1H803_9APIC|nr:30S ribosomal protein S8 [Nephromyces sp. ex Molgula occidentalis]
MNQFKELLNKIKLYSQSNKKFMITSLTSFKYNLLKFLKVKGYVKDIIEFKIDNKNFLLIELTNNSINTIYFFNSSYKKNYISNFNLLKWVKFKYLVLITTSKGILSASTAYNLRLGGQLLCYIKNN